MLKNLNDKIHNDIDAIKKEIDKLHDLEVRLERFKYNQTQTNTQMNEILKLQNNITQVLQRQF